MKFPYAADMVIPTLETKRLRLRALKRTDAPQIQEVFPHWEIVRYMAAAIPWPYPDDGAEQFVDRVLLKVQADEEYD